MAIDVDALLRPISDERPSGEELRYTQIYDDIKEARRADDPLDMGDWQRDLKTSDWNRVVALALDALETKSKDLQIAVWLTEALAMATGFGGLDKGLRVITGLLESFWETLYPEIEDGDLEYRIAPLEFLNGKVSQTASQIPLTQPGVTAGYTLLKWRESREVGSEADTRNKFGDVDEQRRRRREEMIADGRLSAEEFDLAMAKSSPTYLSGLTESLAGCRAAFADLDTLVDAKFGNEAPRLSDLGNLIEECVRLTGRFTPADNAPGADDQPPVFDPESGSGGDEPVSETTPAVEMSAQPRPASESPVQAVPQPIPVTIPPVVQISPAQEDAVWAEALKRTEAGNFRETLDWLLAISNSQPSPRERSRYRFLVAKLCLKVQRPDLALPIVEQLHELIAELQLERWESPMWIAEVLEALYQCLMSGEPSDENISRGGELFRRICTLDVTKVIIYKQ